MKQVLSLFLAGAVIALLAFGQSTATAQTRGVGAGALMLDDNLGHSITIETPQSPSTEWSAWQAASFPNLWIFPVPPSNGAQSGFVYSGPLSGTALPALLSYWLPPNTTTINGGTYTGGAAGAWDYATTAELNVVSGSGTVNVLPKWDETGHAITNSSITDNGTTVSTSEIFSGNGGGLTNVNADSIKHNLVPANAAGYLANDGSGNLSWGSSIASSKAGIGFWTDKPVGPSQTKTMIVNGTNTITTIVPPFAGGITGLSVVMDGNRTAGTLTAEVYINGTATGLTCTIDGTNTLHNFNTAAATAHPFNAGDLIEVHYTTSGYSPSTSQALMTVFATF